MEDLGNKIKQLRIEKKMTLEEVAQKVGVGKSTVRKWETGMIANMKRDKIAKIAKALDTTPAYLMGWEEKQTETPLDHYILNQNEKMIIETYRETDIETQEMIRKMFELMIEGLKK